jgi:hypothetical protein
MFSSKTFEKLNICIASLCILIVGILVGKYQERIFLNQKEEQIFQLEKDINTGIPSITILGLKDGDLVGTMSGKNIRLSTEKEVALVDKEFNFTLKINNELRKDLVFNVPKNMNYIASSKGKNFYNIYESYALKISPKNRIFFQTKSAAIEAGYIEN